ncbi:MAG TPA: NAD-binding protein [Dermatophilaceae bacterium]|nr:NAD-binding protein [Dermatophilaceae bacterium]
MGNPLLLLLTRPWSRQSRADTRRRPVAVPTEAPSTDAIFLVLRRMRAPLVLLVVIFAVSVAGLTLIPGVDGAGQPVRMTVFDAFYFMSYTATTIGFGELPHAFTTGQRMWVTLSIYASVVGWAYTIGTLFALLQDEGFRQAVLVQRVRRRVRRLDEPFLVVAGYGHAGEQVCRALDDARRRFVVVDEDHDRIDSLAAHQLTVDPPALRADARNPTALGMVGLGHRHCSGVLALTDDDEANLAIVMTVSLLRPEVPVIARCGERAVADRMLDFSPATVINPGDVYGAYLTLAVQRPLTYQLLTWLMSLPGSPLPPERQRLAAGRWVVCADGQFGVEVTNDLRAAGLEVTTVDPAGGNPDVRGAVGLVAGTEHDATNLAMAEHARQENPGLVLSVRQRTHSNAALAQALNIDSVYVPTELVARETLSRIMTPVYSTFLDHVLRQDDAWSRVLLERLVERCGDRTPTPELIRITPREAPSVVRWMRRGHLTLGDLLRDPDARERPLPAVPVLLLRDGASTFTPALDEPLRPGDSVLVLDGGSATAAVSATSYDDAAVEYVATGREVPSTWLWRLLSRSTSVR